MVLKAVVKALKKADELKDKLQGLKDLVVDTEAWSLQQELQRIYRQVLILDLEYALDRKVEQDLWNYGFKNFIGNLQSAAKDKKNPKHSEVQGMLYWCLETVSGFYLSLLQDICSAYNLDLSIRRKSSLMGCSKMQPPGCKSSEANRNSCYYMCQYCLVHLGDIARYRNQSRQAETFYKYAVELSPSSGQPYNQLAILEANRGDKLSTVYHYVRSVAVRHPFAAAATNLSRTLDKHADEPLKLEEHTKLSSADYVAGFLKLHGLLHTHSELDVAERLLQVLATSLTAHIATESLSSWKLVQMFAINMFAWTNMETSATTLTSDETREQHVLCGLLATCLSAFLLPVYTIKQGEPLLSYFAMPAIKLTLEWIKLEPALLHRGAFRNRLQIWPSLCKLLNDLQPNIADFQLDMCEYKDRAVRSLPDAHVPLPEDRDVQGFLPLEPCLQQFKFTTDDLSLEVAELNKLRAARLVQLGVWLAGHCESMACKLEQGVHVFEVVGRQEPPSGDLIRELEEMCLTKHSSPTPSEGSGSVTGTSTPDSSGFFALGNPTLRSVEFSSQEALSEKRPGILKSQGSLEKAVEKVRSEKPATSQMQVSARGLRNVAMQAIINKNWEETKQVTFKTPTPAASPDRSGQKPQKDETKRGVKSKPAEVDHVLAQQQKLMNVLSSQTSKKPAHSKKTPLLESSNSFPALPNTKKEQSSSVKQQLLSDLLSKDADQQQPQHLSGLLNLNKQQQQMLTDSKKVIVAPEPTPLPPAPAPVVQKTVDKMELARKEYEAAMFAVQKQQQMQQQQQHMLQQQQQQQQQEQNNRAFVAGLREPQQMTSYHNPPPPQQPILVRLSQPVMNMPGLNLKYPPHMFLPWQEPEQPPMPPSWWSEAPPARPPPPQVPEGFSLAPQPRDSNVFESPAHQPTGFPTLSMPGSYSLFSTPNWSSEDADSTYSVPGGVLPQQSFWSGPGPSPLERLLEQQKQMRESPSQPKSGT